MRKIIQAFFKERRWQFLFYVLSIGVFCLVLYLYEIRGDAVEYAVLLWTMAILIYEGILLLKYIRRCHALSLSDGSMEVVPEELPEAEGFLEEKYQEMIGRLCEEKWSQESAGRIARQELLDYYGMWVHQIKTPIAALNLLLQTCREEYQIQEARAMELELFKIQQYVEMALTYLRMEDMSADLALEKCSLDSIVKQAVRKYSRMFIQQKISLQYEPLNQEVLTDEKWMTFVLEQLISNALKYTKQGTVSIYMEGKLLIVEDTGIGIQAEDLPRVFERGFTGYNGRADKKSTGIGLYLCKSVMDKLGHKIWITSEVGAGSKVYMDFARDRDVVE